jgi:hypothetical protein
MTRWLAGFAPSEYVVACYEAGLSSGAFREGVRRDAVDAVLGRFVRMGTVGTALADAYARVFAPAGELRRKQVLLVSILESAHPSDVAFEPRRTNAALSLAGLFAIAAGFAVRLAVALPVVGSVHLVTRAGRAASR